MRKHYLLFLFVALILGSAIKAQTRGTKIGYIDMEYILQNVPDYKEAQNQLEQKAQNWKQEIETKKNEINKLKEALQAEKALLTKGLIEERESEITFLENENLELQQTRFGPSGQLMTQKSSLTKPIQDQVFTAVQDIAEAKKYDFIFDKASDLTMLFAAKRFDISDQVIRVLNRIEKKEQLTKKQQKEADAKQAKEDAMEENPAIAERQKALDERKLARDKAVADRLLLQQQRKKDAEEKRNQILSDKDAKRNGLSPTSTKTTDESSNSTQKEAAMAAAAEAKQQQIDARAKTLEDRKNLIEQNKKAAEEKRAQILLDREAKRLNPAATTNKVTSDTKKIGTVSESTTNEIPKTVQDIKKDAAVNDTIKLNVADPKQQQADSRAKILEDRKKVIEDRKRELEEKRAKTIQDREDALKARQEQLNAPK